MMQFAAFLSVLLAAPAVNVTTLDGAKHSGQLVELSARGVVVLAGDRRETIATEQLQTIHFGDASRPAEVATAPLGIELIDGSSLAATSVAVSDRTCHAVLADGQKLDIPTSQVASLRLQALAESAVAEWANLVQAKTDADRLVIRKGDALDYHKGTAFDVTETHVNFEIDGEKLPVKRTKVQGLIFYHPANRKLAEAACRLVDAGGSQWSVQTLEQAGKLSWTTPAGLRIERDLGAVVRIEYASENLLWLHELKPESNRWTPRFVPDRDIAALADFYAPRTDGAAPKSALRLGGQAYASGVRLHSRSEVVYRLPERFRRFKSVVGISDATRPGGAVRLVIRGDDRILLDEKVTGGDAPMPIDLDLTGVRRLSILVDLAGSWHASDELLLCEARLLR